MTARLSASLKDKIVDATAKFREKKEITEF